MRGTRGKSLTWARKGWGKNPYLIYGEEDFGHEIYTSSSQVVSVLRSACCERRGVVELEAIQGANIDGGIEKWIGCGHGPDQK